MAKPKLIAITGISATGKTSLAKLLAKEFGYKHYELDEVIWDYELGQIYPESLILEKLNKDEYKVVEGAYIIPQMFEQADLIIYLYSKLPHILYRQWHRYLELHQLRKKYGFWRTVRLSYRTIRNVARHNMIEIEKSGFYNKDSIEKYLENFSDKVVKESEYKRVIKKITSQLQS